MTLSPAGGADNLYDFNKIIAPNESVRYLVKFTTQNQAVSVLMDVSTATGAGAKFMNLVQAEVDLISLLVPGFGTGFKVGVEMYPDIVNAFGAMPHLNQAGDALFSSRPDMVTFLREMLAAARAGEFDTLGSTLAELGFKGAKEAFKILAEKPGEALKIGEIILRNFGNVHSAIFQYTAGSIRFVAE